MRARNITFILLTSCSLLACDSEGEEAVPRSVEVALEDLEEAHQEALACVELLTGCLEGAAEMAGAEACVAEAESCFPGDGDGPPEVPEAGEDETGGDRPELPEQADDAGDRPELPEQAGETGEQPELPEQAGNTGEQDEGGDRPELPEVAQARAGVDACVSELRACLESTDPDGQGACGEAMEACVSGGPIDELCVAAEDLCATENVPAQACERVEERC